MRELTEIEKETYNFIKEVGEIQTTNLPNKRMWGAIPNLRNMGLIEVFMKYTSLFRSRKKKFVKIKEQ
jgi:predicted transcriptional regulator